MGDRKNITAWHNGDELVKSVSKVCNNTIVVMHTVGGILVGDFAENPNVTAIVWQGLPGQESGSALADVLYGRSNPGGKTPFTWGKTRESYGPPILTTQNNGNGAPQADFSEKGNIDYRYFDANNEDPVYEFGFGMSYTTFAYSDLQVNALPCNSYQPTTGKTKDAPTYGSVGDPSEYLYPDNVNRVPKYIYPWLNSTNLKESTGGYRFGEKDAEYIPEGARASDPQPLLPAGGAPGGNPGLYDEMFTVKATIRNTGKVAGDEVPQLVSSLHPPDDQ